MLSAFGDRMPSERADELVDALTWLGLIPNGTGAALPSIPNGTRTPLDLLAALLAHRLRYQEGERDLVVLSHEIVAKGRTPGAQEETHTSQLVVYGDAQASAMSRTVGLPVAFAALRVLDGHVKARGVHGPTERAIWAGVLDDLESVNLGMDERVIKTQSMESKLAADYQAVA
jgi:alpha-aminoadipic semialdehyde synthase